MFKTTSGTREYLLDPKIQHDRGKFIYRTLTLT